MKLVYLFSRAGKLNNLDEAELLTMTSAGTGAGYPAFISADSQDNHVFVNPEWIKHANVHITPIAESVQLGDDKSARIIGRCSMRLSLGPFTDRCTGLVLESFGQHHDIVLGEE